MRVVRDNERDSGLDEAEAERHALIRGVLDAPQESDEQVEAWGALFVVILPELERYACRPYLPHDETEGIAVQVSAKLRRNNFANLRKFMARFEERPTWRLEMWLRKLCKWKIDSMLKKAQVVLVNDDDAMTSAARSTTLILGKLIRSEDAAFSQWLLEEAATKLNDEQCVALHIYFQHIGDAPAGTKHAQSRAAYEAIAHELKRDNASEARRLVTTAKLRLSRAIQELRDHETAGEEEES